MLSVARRQTTKYAVSITNCDSLAIVHTCIYKNSLMSGYVYALVNIIHDIARGNQHNMCMDTGNKWIHRECCFYSVGVSQLMIFMRTSHLNCYCT